MDAEEIIQQKEWHQLNADEQLIIKALADTEQEYNLLKKMLQISGDEQYEVPQVSPVIKTELVQHLPAKRTVPLKRYWYAAAAAILLFACATLFILTKKTTGDAFRENAIIKSIQVPPQIKQDQIIIKDTVNIIKESDHLAIHKKINSKQNIVPAPIQGNNDSKDRDRSIALNTKVADQKELLNLVTEIY